MEIRKIETQAAPSAGGHYSQAVVHNGIVYVSGQLGFVPGSEERLPGTIEEQTEQALENVRAILEAAGSDLGRVLRMTIYISDIELWGPVNQVYARVMGEHRPARAVIPVKELHYGYQIEIEAMAAI
ncbi:MAG TPA: RidA family protein [Blastocatellia bacterium]|jgi:2-iminobutanoate/2-iminopropanoate deaminase|nr:RidA family protein [Blastocatellia bacterium]